MNTFSSLFAFLGSLFLLFHGTVNGAPIPKEITELASVFIETPAPAKTTASYEPLQFPINPKSQLNYLGRRASTTGGLFEPFETDTAPSEKAEEPRYSAVDLLRRLAEKFRSSYQWVKTSNGWEWAQRQGTKIGELVKKWWNWCNMILRGKPTIAAETKITLISVDDSHPVAVLAGNDNHLSNSKDNRKSEGAIVSPLEAVQEDAEEGHHDQIIVRPPRDKGKGRARMPAAEDTHTEGNSRRKHRHRPLRTQEGDSVIEAEEGPYGDTPGPSNYREKARGRHTKYNRPAFGDAVPPLFKIESVPNTDVDTDPVGTSQGLEPAEIEFEQVLESAAINQASVAELEQQAPVTDDALAVYGFGPYTGPAQQVPAIEQEPVIKVPNLENPAYRYIRPAFRGTVPTVAELQARPGWVGVIPARGSDDIA